MEDDVGPGDEPVEGGRVVDRTRDDAAAGARERRGRPARQAGHLGAGEPLEQVAADEARSAGNGGFHI